MTKTIIKLDLSGYDKMELIELMKLKVLTKDEVKAELMCRGMDEYKVISMIRAA